MIIIPLSHESGEVQRLPYVTLGILILNVLLLAVTYYAAPKTVEQHVRQESKLVTYYASHPYLELPEETFRKLSPGSQARIGFIRQTESVKPSEDETESDDDEQIQAFLDEMGTERPEAEATDDISEAEAQENLDAHIRDFESSFDNLFYRKYGYIPARGGVLTLFSSIFLHSGFFHLLFNMLFLWLSGGNIEDLWGRGVFAVFYLLSGIVASLSHMAMFPESTVPCVGASGAIAALMGAFMIRLYNTKIHFFYFFFFGFKMKHGTFQAPAYLTLPLWLAQQLFEAYKASGSGDDSGVALWAHIGGFVFGAIVAALFKVSGFEEKVLAPAIARKVNLVDENFSSGTKKLREDDVEGAIDDLRKAVVNDRENPIPHSELSKAFCKKGDKKAALLELKRAVNLYIRQGLIDNAVDDYLEISTAFPDMVLEPVQQVRIIEAIEEREMYPEAANACKNLFARCQREAETKDGPEAVAALTRYGDICLHHLSEPKAAFQAYKKLLESCQYLSSEQKKQLRAKAENAVKAAQEKARQDKLRKKAETEAEAEQKRKKAEAARAKPRKPKPKIPIAKRIRLAKPVQGPGKYKVMSVSPYEAGKILPAPGGIDLKRLSEPHLLFQNISLMCAAEFEHNPDGTMFADIFIAGKSRPYRIFSDRIAYTDFLPKCHTSSFDNFRQLILHIISHIDSVYLDQGTMTFLKIGKSKLFPNQEEFEFYEKNLWKQIIGEVRFQCENCWEVYWVSGERIPKRWARIKCKKCGQPISVAGL